MRVYISGPITGHDDYASVFAAYAVVLQAMGYVVVNPAATSVPEWTWADYMQYDLMLLSTCDYIYMLPGWQSSRGARIERRYAKRRHIRELVVEGR